MNNPGTRNQKPILYLAQNRQIHKAAQQLGLGLEELRDMAGALNLGIRSLSTLSLDQRQELIERLASLGGQIRNPAVTDYDRQQATGNGQRGKVVRFPSLSDKQRKLIDDLASKVQWREDDGFARLCHKQIKAAYPRNNREVTKIRLALQSLIRQQEDKKDVGADPRVRP